MECVIPFIYWNTGDSRDKGERRVKHATDKERCEILAEYLIERDATVRAVAYEFSISKSTVHKDVTEKLEQINPDLYDRVRAILDKNKSERHLRGGEATRVKYMKRNKRST